MIPFYWLMALAVFLVIEIITLGLTTIWFAGGALLAFLAALLGAPLAVQLVIFFVTSFLMLFFTRPVAEKHLNNSRTKTNVDSLTGREVLVTEEIDNFKQSGAIVIDGMEWTARSADDSEVISKDSKVVVKEVSGVKVIVSPTQHI